MTGIFKAYDIRGVYPAELNEDLAMKVAQAFGTLHPGRILIGSDVRKSSPSLKRAVIDGLLSTGVTVVDVGIISTPMAVFGVAHFGLDGGLIITASHNPPEYNGIKPYDKNGVFISYESGIGKIEETVKNQNFTHGKGSVESLDIEKSYSGFLAEKIKHKKNLKIVVDCLNGSYSRVAPSVLRSVGAEIAEIRCGLNGEFPADGPDPSKTHNVEGLRKSVVDQKADAGFAYDGDGDRFVLVDEKGNIMDPKIVFSILIRNATADNPKIKIIYDAITSKTVLDCMNEAGAIPIACRVGRSYINQKMLNDGAFMAGEISGHYYFRELYGADDALFASMKILEYLARTGKKLSELLKEFKQYHFETARFPIKDSEKFTFVEQLKREFSGRYRIETLDGVRVNLDGGWAVFRPSNTEPKLSVTFEAPDQQSFDRIKVFVDKIVERIPK